MKRRLLVLACAAAAVAPMAQAANQHARAKGPKGTVRKTTATQPAHRPAHKPLLKSHKGPTLRAVAQQQVQTSSFQRYASRPEVMAQADDLAQRLNLEASWVRRALEQAAVVPAVQRLIMPAPAGTARNWAAYRDRFVEPTRIQAGLAFWRQAEPWLQRAQAQFGVPPHIVAGIVGVETFYGRIMGSFRVLDALATLSFDFPSGRSDRSAFFRSELEAFLQWCAREGRPPSEPLGSFAGAMGLPQFMPSSIQKWAVDFDGDGRIDLHHNLADVVGSVARYLADHGWVSEMPTHFDVQAPEPVEALAQLKAPDIKPTFSAVQLQQLGVRLPEAAAAHPGPMAFVELQNGAQAPQHVLGTQNFWVITRYNWSAYYAMAVIALAQALAAARR